MSLDYSTIHSTSPSNHTSNIFPPPDTYSASLTNETPAMNGIPNLNPITMKIDDQVVLSDESYVQSPAEYSVGTQENGQPPSSIDQSHIEDKPNKLHQMSNGKVTSDTFISNGSMNGNANGDIYQSNAKPNGQANGVVHYSDLPDNHSSIETTTSLTVSTNETTQTYSNHQSNSLTNGLSQMSNGSIATSQSTSELTIPLVAISLNCQPMLSNGSSSSLKTPFPLLAGELFYAKEEIREGIVYLTNHRLYVEPNKPEGSPQKNYQLQQQEQLINLPIDVIDSIELRDLYILVVFTKYVQSFSLTFHSSETANLWHKRLSDAPNVKVEELFCFKFFSGLGSINSCNDTKTTEMLAYNRELLARDPMAMVTEEFTRMKFDKKDWKISELNKDFKFCKSYPQYFIVPNELETKDWESVANFRFSARIPVVVWRSQKNGCVIVRSSQPVVGWLGWRSTVDEKLMHKICSICNQDTQKSYVKDESNGDLRPALQNGHSITGDSSSDLLTSKGVNAGECNGQVTSNGHALSNGSLSGINHSMEKLDEDAPSRKLLILDARSYTAALANRALGGGCECPEYYPSCDVQFMGLPNIHNIRKSFDSLRYICETARIDQSNWFTLLDNTKWFLNLSSLIKVSTIVVDTISIQERPVLVHCSDGWDRTPQVVALAQLMLDPYYRTIEGFKVLIEREWLQFGHKFADRCRSSSLNIDPNERCPVFLQWLDCVHQLIKQFPNEFEFNVYYLIKLVYHTYSSLFGTFTCNNVQERNILQVNERTISIWSYLEIEKFTFTNFMYVPKLEVLRPSCRVKDMIFWEDVYVPVSGKCVANTILNYDVCSPDEKQRDSSSRIFCNRKSDMVSSVLNEANIDESNLDGSNNYCYHDKKCPSQSKCDLNRSASYENLSTSKKNMSSGENMRNGISKNSLQDSEQFESEGPRIGRHLSDSYLFKSETFIDRDKFLSSSIRNNDQACDTEQEFTNDESLDKRSTDNECANLGESISNSAVPLQQNGHARYGKLLARDSARSFDNGTDFNVDLLVQEMKSHPSMPPPAINQAEHPFDIDGQANSKDKPYLQLQQFISDHKVLIFSLYEQLNEARNKYKSLRNRSAKPNHQSEDSNNSRKHSTYNGDSGNKPGQDLALDSNACDSNLPNGRHCSACTDPTCRTRTSNGKKAPKETMPPLYRPRSMTESRTYPGE